MNTGVSVLCARVRVEEKQLLAALADAGVDAAQALPTAAPVPVSPVPPCPSPSPVRPGSVAEAGLGVQIDRLRERAAAGAYLRAAKTLGATTIDAGLAATGDRLTVASALAAAGVPRPATTLALSGEAALAAVEAAGHPATLLPLSFDAAPIALLDADMAEAVLEHREVLGGTSDVAGLVQDGVAAEWRRVQVVVVDGVAAAMNGLVEGLLDPTALRVAEFAATVLGASCVGIDLVASDGGWLVWDVSPTPDFRHAVPLVEGGAPVALAALASRLAHAKRAKRTAATSKRAFVADRQEVRGGAVLIA